MSIIPKLATSLERRDEVPNQELAAEIVRSGDSTAVNELVENLSNKSKGIRNDCIKVLYEIGYSKPDLIAGHFAAFMSLLTSKDNRLQWGGMTALSCIVNERPADMIAALPKIIDSADNGSVITRDHCVNILIGLSLIDEFADQAFPLLLEQMMGCPANQLPMYAERSIPAVTRSNAGRFVDVLTSRLDDIERESGRKRVEKSIKKVNSVN